MLETLLIALRLQVAYSTNGIQYYVRKIPLIRRLFIGKSYDASDIKMLFGVLGGSWQFIKKIATKFVYLLLMIIAVDGLRNLGKLPDNASVALFIQTFIFSTFLGGILNNPLWGTDESDYYAICLLRMDSRKYTLSQYGFYLIHSTLAYIAAFFTVGHFIADISFVDGIILTVFFVSVKLTATAITLIIDDTTVKNVNWPNIIASVLILAAAVLLPVLHIVLPIMVMRIVMLAFIIPAGVGIWKLLTYKNYSYTYRKTILETREAMAQVKDSSSVEMQSRRDVLTDKMNATSNKHGFAYMHELFVKRHVKLLWKPSFIISGVAAILFAVCACAYFIYPDAFASADIDIIALLPAMVFVMYLINRGLPFTQALYVNCDHSMLTFSFYRASGSILRLFALRLVSIIKVNLLPAAVIGAGLDILHYLLSASTNPVDYFIIFISSVCLSIFFSVHYLVIYYLLQPYNAATEVKSPAYSAIKGLTYVVCYMMLQIDISSLMFGIGTIVFCLAYCIIGCVLVYFLAPKTFHIKN